MSGVFITKKNVFLLSVWNPLLYQCAYNSITLPMQVSWYYHKYESYKKIILYNDIIHNRESILLEFHLPNYYIYLKKLGRKRSVV